MDKKEAKEFSHDAIYGLHEMLTLINDQTQKIEYLHDKLDDITRNCNGKITNLEGQIDKLTETFESHNEDAEFDGEYDFYEK